MKARGVITLVFDDGYEAVYKNVLPILRELDLLAVFAIPIDGKKFAKTEQRAIRGWQDWLKIKANGHEVASHSMTHPNLTLVDDLVLENELAESQKKLGAVTIVYPGGAVDDRVTEAAARHYRAGRTVKYGFEDLPPKDPLRLKSYNFSKNNFSVAKANMLALWACWNKKWLIETYHMVDDKDGDMVHSVKTSALKRHLKFLKRLPIDIKTISAIIT